MKISAFIENKEDYHHIVNVMRYKEGQNIIVTFSDENVFKCKIISINDQSIEIKLAEKQQINTELPQNITICSGLIKADKYEWMIQKATEMGANEFIAVAMERSVVKLNDSKVERNYRDGKNYKGSCRTKLSFNNTKYKI